MRTLLIILLILALIAGGAVLYLFVSVPKTALPVRFPLASAQRELLSRVPADAEIFALVPSAALLHGKLLANPVTREPVLRWAEEHELPRPWMLGGADLVVWKSGSHTSYAVRLDRFRAFFVRLWLMASSNADARWEGKTLIMHAPEAVAAPGRLDDVLALTAGLPEGDVLLVQRAGSRGAFPPIGRPAVTSVRVTPADVVMVSHAPAEETNAAPRTPVSAQFPRGAILAGSFTSPPRVLGDFNRLVGARIDTFLKNGGTVAIYDVDTGTLLPRPKGLLIISADADARAQADDIGRVIGLIGEMRETDNQLLVSFDKTSMGLYINDALLPAAWPANAWAVRLDPQRLIPILRRAGDNPALRFAAPRVHRAARDLRRWIAALEQARSVEAADSVNGGVEELRVRVAAK